MINFPRCSRLLSSCLVCMSALLTACASNVPPTALPATAASTTTGTTINTPAPPDTTPLIPSPAIVAQTGPLAAEENRAAKTPPEAASKADANLAALLGRPEPHIALILPLASKTFGKVADAVKLGFIAGAAADGKAATPYRIYAADDESAAPSPQTLAGLYRLATAAGAIAIVGGVTRDGASVLARLVAAESSAIPSLALNAPDASIPENFFYISLNLDWEARLVARAAAQEGFKRAAIVTSATALSRRIQDSFEKEWLRLGGEVVAQVAFGGDANASATEAQRIKAPLDRAKPDVIFIAADPRAARSARPYLPAGTAVFSTSHALDAKADIATNIDLEGVRFLEMPWFVEKDHPAVMAYSRPEGAMPIDYERLYALGIDAWRLTQLLLKSATTQNNVRGIPPLDGVTGRLTLDGAQFVRALSTVEMRDGQTVLSRSAE
jgi:outer membrane PBP1 activator LpoA protein